MTEQDEEKARQSDALKCARLFFMSVLVVSRFNPDWKNLYRKHIEAGMPPKVALSAIMRTPVVMANALVRGQRKWAKTWLVHNGYFCITGGEYLQLY